MTKKPKKKKPLKDFAVLGGIAFQMAIIIAGGAFFGVWLDQKYPNNYSAYTIIFSLISVFIALYNVIKQANQLNEK